MAGDKARKKKKRGEWTHKKKERQKLRRREAGETHTHGGQGCGKTASGAAEAVQSHYQRAVQRPVSHVQEDGIVALDDG